MTGQLIPQHRVRNTSKRRSFLESECIALRWEEECGYNIPWVRWGVKSDFY
jgi:hypothetical protein